MKNPIYPAVSVSVEGIRHSIVAALGEHSDDITRMVDESLKEQLKPETIAWQVSCQVGPAMQREVESRVKGIVREIMWSDEVSSAMRDIIYKTTKDKFGLSWPAN